VLVRGLAVECRVRSLVVVEELVVGELGRDASDAEGPIVAVPELDAGGEVGALGAAVLLEILTGQDMHMARPRRRYAGLGSALAQREQRSSFLKSQCPRLFAIEYPDGRGRLFLQKGQL